MNAILPTWKEEFEAGVLAAEPKLRAFAMSLCRHPERAEDLVQDTMLRAFLKFEQYAPGTNLNGWLFTILRNEWYSQCRKSGREVSDPDGVFASSIPVPEGQSAAFDLKVIRKRMRLLNSLQRHAIEIVAMNGYQYDEAAEMLGIAVGTVKSSVSRARVFLETGDMAALAEDEVDVDVEATRVIQGSAASRVEDLYRSGAAVSEIAKQTGLARGEVMQVIADRKLTR